MTGLSADRLVAVLKDGNDMNASWKLQHRNETTLCVWTVCCVVPHSRKSTRGTLRSVFVLYSYYTVQVIVVAVIVLL